MTKRCLHVAEWWDNHRCPGRICSRVKMSESMVRLIIGRVLHGHQSDGSLSEQDEGEAKAHGLYQRVRISHCRRPNGAVSGRRSLGLNLPVQVHRRRPETHVGTDTKQAGMGSRHSAHYHANLPAFVQRHVPYGSVAAGPRWYIRQYCHGESLLPVLETRVCWS